MGISSRPEDEYHFALELREVDMDVEIDAEWADTGFRLVYCGEEHSFTAVPQPSGGITSVLLNDLQLEIDDEGTVIYAWGLFPSVEKCDPTTFNPPEAIRRRLRFISDDDWTPGISIRINKRPWDVFANAETGWVGVGNPNASSNSIGVEFAPNSIAVIERRSIVAVWLKPTCIGSA